MVTWHQLWFFLLSIALLLLGVFSFPGDSEQLPGILQKSGLLVSLFDLPRELRESFLNTFLMSWLSTENARGFALWWAQTSDESESLTGALIAINLFALVSWPLFYVGEGVKWVNNTYKRSWQRSVDLANK